MAGLAGAAGFRVDEEVLPMAGRARVLLGTPPFP